MRLAHNKFANAGVFKIGDNSTRCFLERQEKTLLCPFVPDSGLVEITEDRI